jgi:hypothetical protein
MAANRLLIAKRMMTIHGKARPFIEVKAEIAPGPAAFLLEYFAAEAVFRRTAYAGGFTDGGLQPSPPLARMLANFVKNDACPEITVKTLMAGQKYEGGGMWDILCFEFIAKRSFDALVELAAGANGFTTPNIYLGFDAAPDATAFEADTLSEMASVPAPIAVGGVQGMADAA